MSERICGYHKAPGRCERAPGVCEGPGGARGVPGVPEGSALPEHRTVPSVPALLSRDVAAAGGAVPGGIAARPPRPSQRRRGADAAGPP